MRCHLAALSNLESPYLLADTVQRLLTAFAEKSIKVLATIDQQAEARAAGLVMPPTMLIIFGNPKAGMPLILRHQRSAMPTKCSW